MHVAGGSQGSMQSLEACTQGWWVRLGKGHLQERTAGSETSEAPGDSWTSTACYLQGGNQCTGGSDGEDSYRELPVYTAGLALLAHLETPLRGMCGGLNERLVSHSLGARQTGQD